MTKNPTPIKVVFGSANEKLVGKKIAGTNILKYVAMTTYSEVGPTCPVSCWFHPTSERRAEWPEGFKPCYAKRGHTAFSTGAKAFEGATFDDFGLLRVQSRIDNMMSSHAAEDAVIDIIRWHTGGDVLYPNTGEVWDQHIDLILDTAHKATELGIPMIGYTAAWRLDGVQPLKHLFLASCQSYEEAELAASMGWQVALAVVKDQYEEALAFLRGLGLKVIGCPEQLGKADSCAECGWCAYVDPDRIRKHMRTKYMLYRKRGKQIGLAGSVLFIVHN